jgi:hypothetical protein
MKVLKHQSKRSFRHFWNIPVITEMCVPQMYMWVSPAKIIDLIGFVIMLEKLLIAV